MWDIMNWIQCWTWFWVLNYLLLLITEHHRWASVEQGGDRRAAWAGGQPGRAGEIRLDWRILCSLPAWKSRSDPPCLENSVYFPSVEEQVIFTLTKTLMCSLPALATRWYSPWRRRFCIVCKPGRAGEIHLDKGTSVLLASVGKARSTWTETVLQLLLF